MRGRSDKPATSQHGHLPRLPAAAPAVLQVVTVPAHFGQAQQGATHAAAQQAGIPQVQLLQEPVAAALAYGINGGTDGDTVLVFDVGGGTFDVRCGGLLCAVVHAGGAAWR